MSRDDRVAGLMIGDAPFLFLDQPAALAFRAGDDFFDRVVDVLLGDRRRSPAGRQQGGFVHRVGEVRAGEPGRGLGDPAEIDVGGKRFFSA